MADSILLLSLLPPPSSAVLANEMGGASVDVVGVASVNEVDVATGGVVREVGW